MVKLFCAVVGVADSAFSVRVDESNSVDDLKKAIAVDQKYDFAASKLQLFLAKKDGAWLKDDDSVALQLEKGEIDDVQKVTTEEQLKPTWTVQDVLIANNMTAPKSRQIHVLVVVPEHSAKDHQLLQLQEALLHHTLMDEPTSTSARSNDFKANLIRTYQCDMGTYQDDMGEPKAAVYVA